MNSKTYVVKLAKGNLNAEFEITTRRETRRTNIDAVVNRDYRGYSITSIRIK